MQYSDNLSAKAILLFILNELKDTAGGILFVCLGDFQALARLRDPGCFSQVQLWSYYHIMIIL